nr:polyprotein [Banana bract mosaic virus]
MATITFGQFTVALEAQSCLKFIEPAPPTSVKMTVAPQCMAALEMECDATCKVATPDDVFDKYFSTSHWANYFNRRNCGGLRMRGTTICYAPATDEEVQRILALKQAAIDEEVEFLRHEQMVHNLGHASNMTKPKYDVKPDIVDVPNVQTYCRKTNKKNKKKVSNLSKGACNKSMTIPSNLRKKPKIISEADFVSLIQALLDIQMQKPTNFISLIGKYHDRVLPITKAQVGGKQYLKCILKHHSGINVQIEMQDKQHINMVCQLAHYVSNAEIVDDSTICKGWSGIVIPNTLQLQTPFSEIIVRGRLMGRLVDAREKLGFEDQLSIDHYSEPAGPFWEGFRKGFTPLEMELAHKCTPDNSAEMCGQLMAQLFQMVHPCRRISCKQCFEHLANMSTTELQEVMRARYETAVLNGTIKELLSFRSLDECVRRSLVRKPRNIKMESCMEVQRITQHSTKTQLMKIDVINRTLLKFSEASESEVGDASDALLELTRWFNKHLNNFGKPSLETFRNKAASKALLNPSLLCDNQLDKNGNFLWNERGHHAKRFFKRYFDIIDHTHGYQSYELRVSPNCTRKLAIGRLLVSTNIVKNQAAMVGESIQREPLTNACISKIDNGYVYTCCCVTNDVGEPLYSQYRSPSARHIVIGTSGDPKIIKMPQTVNNAMYIAKPGYCYLNIFLAMLLNVDDESAKEFTVLIKDEFIPQLGEWPTLTRLASVCYTISLFYPKTANAELPRILVDHANKTMHVIDSYGSVTTGYHILKAGTVKQLIDFSSNELQSEMKDYLVGGTLEDADINKGVMVLIKAAYRPHLLRNLIAQDPYLLLLSLISPTVIKAMHNSKAYEQGLYHWVTRDKEIGMIFTTLHSLAERVSRAQHLMEQRAAINKHIGHLYEEVRASTFPEGAPYLAQTLLLRMAQDVEMNESLLDAGFATMNLVYYAFSEKKYQDLLNAEWRALKLSEKFSRIMHTSYYRISSTLSFSEKKVDLPDLKERSTTSLKRSFGAVKRVWSGALTGGWKYATGTASSVSDYCFKKTFCAFTAWYGDALHFVNVLLVITLLTQLIVHCKVYMKEHLAGKYYKKQLELRDLDVRIGELYKLCKEDMKCKPTQEEFAEYLKRHDERLSKHYHSYNLVNFQSKTVFESGIERVVAVFALLAMIFDTSKSDAVFRILQKFKTCIASINNRVEFQNLDEIQDIEAEKKTTIDFILADDTPLAPSIMDSTFEHWWTNQLTSNRVVAHYRIGGTFVEFTREEAASIANQIAHSADSEFLIRGAVGSGKSTGLPSQLVRKGAVLLLEPTRPLAENVFGQLRSHPFLLAPTLQFRGTSVFGSTDIKVMTSGFALNYFAHNSTALSSIEFIIFDECHVMDASAMAFYCLLKEYAFKGKILKVSATPPGRECEFKTQHTVKIAVEEHLTFQRFVQEQGTGSNVDVVQHGNNILVYVASYNEVDQLSNLLLEKGHKVTKIDGRTMKVGSVQIVTCGTSHNKHFVVATNIIENGVTLDIDVVVDFGVKVVADLESDNRCIRYKKCAIGFGERVQRLGRVGRVKPGFALRIGHTEKGFGEIPTIIATEAAFLCFTYGLPVMTQNVSTSLLAKCTVQQARVMCQFELSFFFLAELVHYNGTMHPLIFNLLKKYRLRDSEVKLNKLAIPNSCVAHWLSVGEYDKLGVRINCEPNVYLPFAERGIPDTLYTELWKIVKENKTDAGFGRLTTASACSIAYTLSCDPFAIPRTLGVLEHLLAREMEKKAYYESLCSNIRVAGWSLDGIVSSLRRRYMADHTTENIKIIQNSIARLQTFSHMDLDITNKSNLVPHGFLNLVEFQNSDDMARALHLKGRWHGSLICKDFLVAVIVLLGGITMLVLHYKATIDNYVAFEGKRKFQKLKFRDARDKKLGREAYGDDGTIEHLFGEAFTRRGKVKGSSKTVGIGKKTRKFVNMYGFDPTDYSYIRFLDPVTGATRDENVNAPIQLIQDELGNIRNVMSYEDDYVREKLKEGTGIKAYFVKENAMNALEVDLTPHNPQLLCRSGSTISGYPEREFELRQTGPARVIPSKEVPIKNETPVEFEGKSLCRGPRNYDNIAQSICSLTNTTNSSGVHGLGYGSYIITNSHLFQENNGSLTIRSKRGLHTIPDTTTISIAKVGLCDIVILKLPKDVPPFPQKLRFRAPTEGERVIMIGMLCQTNSTHTMVSETSVTYHKEGGCFWKHWIDTKKGDCGLPMVSTKDGFILGIHSLSHLEQEENYFSAVPLDFENEFIQKLDNLEWSKHWKLNTDMIAWGDLRLRESKPEGLFKPVKELFDLITKNNSVEFQHRDEMWVANEIKGNLQCVAMSCSNLVTKHVVRGKCQHFSRYLAEHKDADDFFRPLMSHYGPSRLNRKAFLKDLLKYSGELIVGVVDCDTFENAYNFTASLLRSHGFEGRKFITDTDEIFQSLNMKAAVGAMYAGKKRDYFEGYTNHQKDEIIFQSCLRLYKGYLGIWNGSLKAELRSNEKNELNKTRVFTAAPLDTLLGGKVCVDDFNNLFYDKHIECPWTVGMTKFYTGWDQLLRKLPDGWVYCDADGSQFDSSLSPYLINSILRLRLEFAEDWDEGKQMLRNLYTEIVYTPILVPDGSVVKKFKGNNSGQPSTVVDNTLMVVLAMHYSLIKEGWNHDDIKQDIVFFANGDDLLIAIKPNKVCTLDKLQENFLALGLKYDFSNRTTDRSNLWYMSHQGLIIDDMYIPKLEMERIVSILEWNRSDTPIHRAEAICAAMIEAWGYPDLLQQIRKFYMWLSVQDDFRQVSEDCLLPYISEIALRRLYTSKEPASDELRKYYEKYILNSLETSDETINWVEFQSGTESTNDDDPSRTIDAGGSARGTQSSTTTTTAPSTFGQPTTTSAPSSSSTPPRASTQIAPVRDRDVDAGSTNFIIPRIKPMTGKMRLPRYRGKTAINVEFLLQYKPDQFDLSNAIATREQYDAWCDAVKREYAIEDEEQFTTLLGGLMVWCIENGTSPNLNGTWSMMDKGEQLVYQLKPIIENAQPTFRQIMAHFSDAAEAYITMRNVTERYMPRWGALRGLNDISLARYAFDFYVVTSKTTNRAREAHTQMKAAAIRGSNTRLFGLDGNLGPGEENTERHTVEDVKRDMHSLLGVKHE